MKEDALQFWLDTAVSTMETAREYTRSEKRFLVSARLQTAGRGSQGRSWTGLPDNVHLTCGFPERLSPITPPEMLPFISGLSLWEATASRLPGTAKELRLKWPNDLLLHHRKLGGILIETHRDYYLIGIGVNYAATPEVTDGGREACCLVDYGASLKDRKAYILDIFDRLDHRLRRGDSPSRILEEWREKADWKRPLALRRRPDQKVLPLDLNANGQLQVEYENGSREWLSSEYLI